MAQYRKKPIVIEAVQWTGDNYAEVLDFVGDAVKVTGAMGELAIRTLEDGLDGLAKHVASPGDWIIKGVAGEFYACKLGIFALTYEAV